MSAPSIEVIEDAIRCKLSEGPHWSSEEQVLYYVDIQQGRVLRYDPATKICSYATVYGHDPVSFIVPIKDKDGKEFMIGRHRSLCRLHWDISQEREEDGAMPKHWVVVMAKVDLDLELNRLNDGKCDPQGRLWAGSMGWEAAPGKVTKPGQGSVYSFVQNAMDDKEAFVQHKFADVDLSNGLEWSLDGKTFYYIDSLKFKIEAFDFDGSTGQLSNRRDLLDFKACGVEGFPDGMTIDAEGHLWVAMFGSGLVVRIDPEAGKVVSTVSFEGLAPNVTSLAFGGSDLKDLYVTSCMDDKSEHGGKLFVVRGTGAQGLPGRSFDPMRGS